VTINLPSHQDIKTCCATLYTTDLARYLLGDSFHPGGLSLTKRLGEMLGLCPGDRVLDVAAGRGASALFLARQFQCEVVGLDYAAENVAQATALAEQAGLAGWVRFEQGDAESLPFGDAEFDAVICECAFCTFPNKPAAAAEFARVLKPGGRIGLSDLTRNGSLPPELDGLLAWIACVADARPPEEYAAYLQQAGLPVCRVEPHNTALAELVRTIQGKLLGAEVLVKLNKLELPGVELDEAKSLARAAAQAVRHGQLGYTLVAGTKAEG